MYGNRVEPKVFLANERTFLNWLKMSVTLGSIASVPIFLAPLLVCLSSLLVEPSSRPEAHPAPCSLLTCIMLYHSMWMSWQVLMTFGRKNAEVAEGVSLVSDSLLMTSIAFCLYASTCQVNLSCFEHQSQIAVRLAMIVTFDFVVIPPRQATPFSGGGNRSGERMTLTSMMILTALPFLALCSSLRLPLFLLRV